MFKTSDESHIPGIYRTILLFLLSPLLSGLFMDLVKPSPYYLVKEALNPSLFFQKILCTR